MHPNDTTPYTLYHFIDGEGASLYVGVTASWQQRHRAHQANSHWYPEVAETRTTLFATPDEAAAAENRLIADAKPRHNRDHSGKSSAAWKQATNGRVSRRKENTEALAAMVDDSSATLNVRESARRAGVSERTIRNWIHESHISSAYDSTGERRITLASLDAYLASRRIIPVELSSTPAAAPSPPSAPDPTPTPALAELVAELVKMRRELTDANWQVGYLTAQLEVERRRVRLLEAGPDVATTPEDDVAAPTEITAASESAPEPSLRARIAAWWRDA